MGRNLFEFGKKNLLHWEWGLICGNSRKGPALGRSQLLLHHRISSEYEIVPQIIMLSMGPFAIRHHVIISFISVTEA